MSKKARAQRRAERRERRQARQADRQAEREARQQARQQAKAIRQAERKERIKGRKPIKLGDIGNFINELGNNIFGIKKPTSETETETETPTTETESILQKFGKQIAIATIVVIGGIAFLLKKKK